jgi:hypothetical protein
MGDCAQLTDFDIYRRRWPPSDADAKGACRVVVSAGPAEGRPQTS